MNLEELNQNILKAIETIMKQELKNYKQYPRNYFEYGRIVTNNGNGTYTVNINGQTKILKPKNNDTYNVNDNVDIMIPNGNRARAYIDKKTIV